MGILGDIGKQVSSEEHGAIRYSSKSLGDPDKTEEINKELAEEYTTLVQANPDKDFSLIHDGLREDILLSWRPASSPST